MIDCANGKVMVSFDLIICCYEMVRGEGEVVAGRRLFRLLILGGGIIGVREISVLNKVVIIRLSYNHLTSRSVMLKVSLENCLFHSHHPFIQFKVR